MTKKVNTFVSTNDGAIKGYVCLILKVMCGCSRILKLHQGDGLGTFDPIIRLFPF